MTLMNIGELAERTGLSVKTVRYYSDLGLVPEAERSAGGYRRYDANAVVRLEFVRSLRELGLDLATIRRILERRADLPSVAATHADALTAQIRLLRVQRAALRALARRHWTVEEVEHVNRLARATADEQRRIIEEFLNSIFTDVNVPQDFEARLRQAVPQLPEEPTDEQIEAWLELVELVRDPDFRDRLRQLGQRSFGASGKAAASQSAALPAHHRQAGALAALVSEKAGQALAAGVDPASSEADPIHDELVARFAAVAGREPDAAYRSSLLEMVSLGYDPRAERYWQLIAIINGWPPIPPTMPAWGWFRDAIAARL